MPQVNEEYADLDDDDLFGRDDPHDYMRCYRRTGRTARMLVEAIRAASLNQWSVVITRTEDEARRMMRGCIKLLESVGSPPQKVSDSKLEIHRGSGFGTIKFRTITNRDWDWRIMRMRGVPHEQLFVDNAAIEGQYYAQLNALHRFDKPIVWGNPVSRMIPVQ